MGAESVRNGGAFRTRTFTTQGFFAPVKQLCGMWDGLLALTCGLFFVSPHVSVFRIVESRSLQ
jgi:hypothetical protein